jgi:hypothetical protein
MDHNLAIIVLWNLLFKGLYKINMDVIHLLVLFEHWYHAHCLDTNVICLFISFKHGWYMCMCVVYTRKSYTWPSYLNNVQHLCLTNTNLWNNRFCTHLEQTMKHVNLWCKESYPYQPICLRLASKLTIFFYYQCNYPMWHHVKTTCNCTYDYKMVLSCICYYDLQLIKMKMKNVVTPPNN